MTFMNKINPTIKYTFTYSEQIVSILDVQIYLSESRKLKTKKATTDCMTLLHLHSHHPLSCEEGIIYSQVILYNMIISEDHILQEEFNNLTHILLACVYPHPQSPVIPTYTTDRNQHFPHCNSLLRYGQTLYSNCT